MWLKTQYVQLEIPQFNFIGYTRILVDVLKGREFGFVVLQEVCWMGFLAETFRDN